MNRLFAIILLCALVLSGCGAKIPAEAPIGETPAPTGGLHRLISNSCCDDEVICAGSGFYVNSLRSGGETYRELRYCNLDDLTLKPVCNKEGCAHDSASCAARMDSDEPFVMYADDNALVWAFFPGDSSNRIEVSEPDGSNRRELCRFNNGQFRHESGMYSDGANLYFMCGEPAPSTEEGYEYAAVLYKVNLASGEAEPVFTGKDCQGYISCEYGGGLLVYLDRITSSGDSVRHDMTYYSLTTGGEARELFEGDPWERYKWIGLDSASDDGTFLAIRRDGKICRVALEGFVETELCDSPTELGEYPYILPMPEGKILLGREGGDYSVIDPDTLKTTSFTLTRASYTGEQIPVQVIAEYGDEYLVCSGAEQFDRVVVATDANSVYTITSERPVLAMISKSDYWSNTPNYRDITEEN